MLKEDLAVRKLSTCLVTIQLLTVDQKHTRQSLLRANLEFLEADSANFLLRFVTI